jgi:hypothetical protein
LESSRGEQKYLNHIASLSPGRASPEKISKFDFPERAGADGRVTDREKRKKTIIQVESKSEESSLPWLRKKNNQKNSAIIMKPHKSEEVPVEETLETKSINGKTTNGVTKNEEIKNDKLFHMDMDMAKQYQVYFPHNNQDNIIDENLQLFIRKQMSMKRGLNAVMKIFDKNIHLKRKKSISCGSPLKRRKDKLTFFKK